VISEMRVDGGRRMRLDGGVVRRWWEGDGMKDRLEMGWDK
jgi:hypothetical protein